MKEQMERILRQWGQRVCREHGGEAWAAFVQPVRQKDRREERGVSSAGDTDLRRWLYIGPAEQRLERDEILLWDGGRYCVREETAVFFGERAVYERAILVRAKEAAV